MRAAARLFARLGGIARMKKISPEARAELGRRGGKKSGEARRKKSKGQ
jgi:hypothetical protein